ncbi:hypothetical protein [Streptomyces sp. BH055]|uniref:hypothetical protein n=1 Tax=Streptomyces sp. BH055 TaxID=3401173 RepID=UPI003BB7BE35
MDQVDRVDHSPLVLYLDDAMRAALCLPTMPVTVDGELVERFRRHLIDQPGTDHIVRLPDHIRELSRV